MKLTRISGLLAVALTVGSVAAYAAGNYSTYPIVGSPSFCASTVSGAGGFNAQGNSNGVNPTGQGQATSGSLCAQTVPAGPPSLTGNELIPADTAAGSGVNPQTVTIPIVLLGAGAVNYQTPLTGTTVTANPTDSLMLLDPAGTIAALTVVMPGPAASLKDGQKWEVTSSQTVTALTLTPGTGTTIGGNAGSTPTAITPSATGSTGYAFIYKASNAKWYRVQ
jgi:hypothetical protein